MYITERVPRGNGSVRYAGDTPEIAMSAIGSKVNVRYLDEWDFMAELFRSDSNDQIEVVRLGIKISP
jgi:hypothetical protein